MNGRRWSATVVLATLASGAMAGSVATTAAAAPDERPSIVILLTDGQNNAGKVSPLTAAEAAKTLGYRVYTIGAGTRHAASAAPPSRRNARISA